MTLQAGIAGLRGTVDQQAANLNPATLLSYAQGFGVWVKQTYPRPTAGFQGLPIGGREEKPLVIEKL